MSTIDRTAPSDRGIYLALFAAGGLAAAAAPVLYLNLSGVTLLLCVRIAALSALLLAATGLLLAGVAAELRARLTSTAASEDVAEESACDDAVLPLARAA